MALEVDRPDGVGVRGLGQRTPRVGPLGPAPPLDHESLGLEPGRHGTWGRQRPAVLFRDQPEELLRPPGGMPLAGQPDHRPDLGGRGVRAGMGAMGAIVEAPGAVLEVALQPFVARRAADAVAPAKFRNGKDAALDVGDETGALIDHSSLSPWHRTPPGARQGEASVNHQPRTNCKPSTRTVPRRCLTSPCT